MIGLVLVAALGLLGAWTVPAVRAATVVAPSIQDSWVREDRPTTNYGSDRKLRVTARPGRQRRALAYFDLSSIPANALINSATARFWLTRADRAGPVDVHPVTSLWQENLVTWSTQPTLDPTPAGTIPPQPRNRVWVTVDITALVQSWTCGLTTDFGIALLGNSNRRSEYASREWPSASERPELVVDYTPGAGCGHFSIGHDGSGDICTVESVTLTRHDAIHGVDIGYAGTASLSTSTGDGTWTLIAGAGTLIDSGGGNATYVFDPADTGQVELGLQASTAGAVDIDVTDGTSAEDPSEDPVLTFVDASSGTFRDEFNAVAYSGSDGTLAWSTDWLEINEGDGPNAGDERVITDLGGLRLRVRDNDGGGEGVEREADLSAFTSATLNFDYRRNLLLRSVDYVTVEVSLDGGANWTELDRFAGPASDTSYSSASYDISAYIAADTRIRFLSSSSMLFFSSVLFDDVEIDASGAGGCSAIDHIVISIGAGAASTCSPHAVTITVEDSSNNPVIDYAGTVTLRTSSLHGDWTVNDANGVLDNATADDGDATYAFVTSDAGDVVLDLANGHADDLTVTVEDAAASVSTTSAVLGFRDDAFVVSPSDPLGAEVVAGRDHRFQAELWRKDPSSGLCAVETGYAGSFDLKAWYTPDASDPGGAPPAIASPLPTTPPAGNNWTASFTAGVASFDLVTTDVGKYVLNLRDDSSGFAVDTGGNPIAIDGSSQTLTTRPFGLSLGGVMAGATVNPANDTSSGLIFTSAGSDFEAVVTAMGWAAADDADDDGVPDVGANLADNTPTASFAWTTSLSAGAPYQPATGVLGGLANATLAAADYAGGQATAGVLQYAEVGSFTLGVAVSGYLGTGGVDVTGESAVVGRFVPFDFQVVPNVPVLQAGCGAGGFTYVGQPFGYAAVPAAALSARNKAGDITENYTAAYWKLDESSLAWPAGTDKGYASAAGTLDTSQILVPKPAVDDLGASTGSNPGEGTLTFSAGGGLSFARTTPLAPFDADIALSIDVIDDDGVAYTGNPSKFGDATPGGGILFDTDKEQRYGRVQIDNAFGSDLLDLSVPMSIEYFSPAGAFDLHPDDVCTDAALSLVDVSPSDNLDATSDTCVQDSGSPGASGAGCATPAAPSHQYVEPPVLGDFNLFLLAPGAGKVGSLDAVVDAPDWLEFDWNGSGDEDPVSRASFGQYKSQGSDFVILSREPFD